MDAILGSYPLRFSHGLLPCTLEGHTALWRPSFLVLPNFPSHATSFMINACHLCLSFSHLCSCGTRGLCICSCATLGMKWWVNDFVYRYTIIKNLNKRNRTDTIVWSGLSLCGKFYLFEFVVLHHDYAAIYPFALTLLRFRASRNCKKS